jgi:predicted TIM-barrel fold metal-dependent hydrolase
MTVIDIHGHVSAPAELYAYKALLLAGRGAHGAGGPHLPAEMVAAAAEEHLALLRAHRIDVQLISARPFQQMHSEKPERIVHWWIQANNDVVAEQCRAYPETFRDVAALPQCAGVSPRSCLDELDRCVRDLGFVGCLLNPDPGEGLDPTPPLGDEWWYPLWEKLVELEVPALVHSAGCRSERESYSSHMITEESIGLLSLLESTVLDDFPTLKLVVSHGGGSVPYQIGRWRASRMLEGVNVESYQHHQRPRVDPVSFDDSLRRLYFDSVLYSQDSLELLIRTVGADRLLFGTEAPGSGAPIDPSTGRRFDDVRSLIESISWLPDGDRRRIFHGNATEVYGPAVDVDLVKS